MSTLLLHSSARVLIESYVGGEKQTEHTLEEERPTGVVRLTTTKVGRLLASLFVCVVTLIVLWRVFFILRAISVIAQSQDFSSHSLAPGAR